MPSHRTSSSRCVAAKLKFAGKQMLQTMVIHYDHDKINALHANLQPPAAAAE
jgi:hypothetical protein